MLQYYYTIIRHLQQTSLLLLVKKKKKTETDLCALLKERAMEVYKSDASSTIQSDDESWLTKS